MTRDEVIEETLRRVVEYFSPLRVYLFGSSARGDMGPRSDIDLLVVVPNDAPGEKLFGGVYNHLAGLPEAPFPYANGGRRLNPGQ